MSLSKVPGSLSKLKLLASLACSTPTRDETKIPQLHVLDVWTLRSEPSEGWLPVKSSGEPVLVSSSAGHPAGEGGGDVQAVFPGPTPTSQMGPLMGSNNATHWHSSDSPQDCVIHGEPGLGLREAQAKLELSRK